MSELRNEVSEPRSAAFPLSLALSPPRSARTRSRAAVFLLPWLVLGAGCLGEEDTGDPELEPNDTAGESTASAGAGGSAAQGTGGAQNGTGGARTPGGTSASAGSGPLSMGSDDMSMSEAEPGETGIFVGVTAAHNAIRAGLALDPPLPDLTWNQELSDFAQEWADELTNSANCGNIFHRDQRMYGENIALSGIRGGGGVTIMYPPEEVVETWAEEVLCWEYGTILGNGQPTASSESCDQECIRGQNSSGCGHYTQLVWRNTREVGCGYSTCRDTDGFSIGVWVCNYDPPGNFVGQTPY